MYTKLKKIEQGFTIVETLIVLAIAALIITIILIAVPDLQRSSRNSNILHDAQNVASAVQTYEGNNQGTVPSVLTHTANSTTATIGKTGATATAQVQASDTINYATKSAKETGTVGTIVVIFGSTCSGANAGPATAAHGTGLTGQKDVRGVAVYYPIEINGGTANVSCIQE